jgi:hypothetical protein
MPAAPMLTVSTPLGADAFILTGSAAGGYSPWPGINFRLEMAAEQTLAVDPTQLVGTGRWSVA